MALTKLIVALGLLGQANSWPQLPQDDDGDFGALTLPVIPATRRSLPIFDEPAADMSFSTLHIPVAQRRALPVDDDDEGARALTLPVIHAAVPGLVKRGIEVQLENRSDVAYYAQLQFGTPPQNIYAQLDTGSFELWVNPDCGSLSTLSDQRFCNAIGQYEPSKSSTSRKTGSSSELKYGIGEASIEYYKDTIALDRSGDDATRLRGVQFGVATSTDEQFAGVLGLGHGKGVNTKYANFVDELQAQGVTRTKIFSVALGTKAEDGGVIVFGGVDAAKFSGPLASLPIVPARDSPDGMARYWVRMLGMGTTSAAGKTVKWEDTRMPVFMDTGATLSLLPPDVVKKIAAAFGSPGLDDAGFYTVDCKLTEKKGTVDFYFDGVKIQVTHAEIIRSFGGDSPSCYLGIMPSNDYALLGDTFLRSAYAVFDLEAEMIHLAQYKNCGSKVKTISKISQLDGMEGICSSSDDDDDDDTSTTATKPATTKSATKTATTDTETKTETGTETGTQTTSDGTGLPTVTDDAPTTTASAETEETSSASSSDSDSSNDDGNGDSAADKVTMGWSVGLGLGAMALMTV